MLRNNDTFNQDPCVGVLVNPLSGGNLRGIGRIRKVIGAEGRVLHREVQTPREVRNVLSDFARNGVNLVAVSGGDGTVQAVLTAIFHHRPFEVHPLLVILRSGTTNLIAGDVGAPGDPARALKRLFLWAGKGQGGAIMVRRAVLRLQVPGHDVRYGMFFGAAGISQGIEYYHRHMHAVSLRGKTGIFLTLFPGYSDRGRIGPPACGKSPLPGPFCQYSGPAFFSPVSLLGG
jgi:hypothetical protein